MDRYSKAVLTVIAMALVWTAWKDFHMVSEAVASTGVVEVKIVGMELPSYKPIPVQVKGEILCRDGG